VLCRSRQGEGLTQAEISRLFSAFSQADSSITRKHGGTGLGLAICKRMVELMHGEIAVRSRVGHGSTFEFTARFGQAKPKLDFPSKALSGLRALVLDPNANRRNILCSALGTLSILTSQHADANHGFRHALGASSAYDLVFVDGSVPGLRALLEAMLPAAGASNSHSGEPLILLLEDTAGEDLGADLLQSVVSAVLPRPVTLSRLHDTVLHLVDRTDPRRPASVASSAEVVEQTCGLRGARVLLAEDNLINQRIARELLESVGVTVDVVDNGALAVERLLGDQTPSGQWDLVLMDLQMPVMDGHAATAAIRKVPRFANLPILAMTAHVLAEERERCYRSGSGGPSKSLPARPRRCRSKGWTPEVA
jgi:two-component system sensor histidine kinase/response regulator